MSDTEIHLAIVELTNCCNLKCEHCYGPFIGDKELDKILFIKIINELKKVNCRMVNLSGGEPLLLGSKIFDYALLAKKNLNAWVQLTTNGLLVDSFNNIKEFKVFDNVQISLDGDERKHDEIRGKGNYKKSVKNLLLLKKNGIETSVMMTVSRKNLKQLKKMLNFTRKIGTKLSIERFTPVGRGAQFASELSGEEWKQILLTVTKEDIDTSDPLKIHLMAATKKYLMENKIIGGCSAGINAVCIDVDLNVLPCPRLRIKCGNLSSESLLSIVKSKKMSDLANRTKLKGKCGKCKGKMICGGCRAYAFASTGDIFTEDPLCFK